MEEIEAPAAASPINTTESKLKRAARIAGIVLIVLLVITIIGAILYGLVSNPPFTAVLRDIFIIMLALVTTIIGLFLAILIFQLQSLMVLLRDEIKPILESANETAGTVRGTTTFVSNTMVNPILQVASFLAAARGSARAAIGTRTKRPPRHTTESSDQ